MVTSIHIIQKNTKTKFRNKIEGNTQDSRLHKCQTSPKPGKSSWSVKKSEKKKEKKSCSKEEFDCDIMWKQYQYCCWRNCCIRKYY